MLACQRKRYTFADPLLRLWVRIYSHPEPPTEERLAREVQAYAMTRLQTIDTPPPAERARAAALLARGRAPTASWHHRDRLVRFKWPGRPSARASAFTRGVPARASRPAAPLPSCCGPSARATVAPDTDTSTSNVLPVIGALLGDHAVVGQAAVLRPAAAPAARTCSRRRSRSPRPCRASRPRRACSTARAARTCARRRGRHRDRSPRSAPRTRRPAAPACGGRRSSPRRARAADIGPSSSRSPMRAERLRRDERRLDLRLLPFVDLGTLLEQRVGDDEAQHGVAEELERLVVGHAARDVFVRARPVRQRVFEQAAIAEAIAQPALAA